MFYYPNKPIRIYDPAGVFASLSASDWIVQPKWNGKRIQPFCDKNGKLTLYNRHGTIFNREDKKLHPIWDHLNSLPLPKPWFLDGELIGLNRIVVWDYALIGGVEEFRLPYQLRLEKLQELLINSICLELIETLPGKNFREIMLRGKNPESKLEGFVLKRLDAANLWGPNSTSENGNQLKFRF